MIKKRYVAIFIALALVVVFSSIYTYHKNYTVQLEESLIGLERLGESATAQYNATFFQICDTVEAGVMALKEDASADNIKAMFGDKTSESYFIEDMILLYEDGTYHSTYGSMGISPDKATPFFALQEEAYCVSLIPSLMGENVFYAVNYLVIDDKPALYLIGLNLPKINDVTRPEMYSAYYSYVYLLSGDGYFIYHPDQSMLGKNIINHSESLQENAQMDNSSYSKLISVIKKDPQIVKIYYFDYTAYDTKKISYANRLDAFNGVLFIAADYDVIRDTHMQATLRTLLPLMACLILGVYTLYRYLYLIKYTDYFTEVKNDLAFRKRLERHLTTGVNEEHYLVLKIENVIHSKDKDFMYDDSVFYKISNYFKLLSPYYEDLYRISRVHYVFVLKSKTSKKVISSLLYEIKRNICNETDGELYIRGKVLLMTLDHMKSINNLNDVDNKLLSNMDDYYNNLMQANPVEFIKYSDVIQELDTASKEKALIENAIVNKTIKPHYQPIVDLRNGELLKHEVLLRIEDDKMPFTTSEFIERAEAEGLMEKVDQTMVRQAFKMYNHRLLTTGKRTPLSINISSRSIHGEMKKFIFDAAKKCDIKPSDITFELTETTEIEDYDDTIAYLKLFRDKGFHIAIDDFGTGYSHVALLSKIQVDYVKIDNIFIENMHHDKQKLKTLNALVYLAKNYNTKVIAEYMDSIDSIEVLKKIGVEYGQGHYFGQAVPEIR